MRKDNVRIVLEDIYQPHNASAVVRSADAFGVQNLYLCENRNRYRVNPDVALGAQNWVNLFRFREDPKNNTRNCLNHLKSQSYTVIATTLSERAVPMDNLKIPERAALVFGTEEEGVSETVESMADEHMIIPMAGFTQSFNISVSVAISLQHFFAHYKHNKQILKLDEAQEAFTRLKWLKNTVARGEIHLKKLCERHSLSSENYQTILDCVGKREYLTQQQPS